MQENSKVMFSHVGIHNIRYSLTETYTFLHSNSNISRLTTTYMRHFLISKATPDINRYRKKIKIEDHINMNQHSGLPICIRVSSMLLVAVTIATEAPRGSLSGN